MFNKRLFLELTPSGFVEHSRQFFFRRTSRTLEWNKVVAIDALLWDVFVSHDSGFRFRTGGDDQFVVLESNPEWGELRKRVFEAFPDIDREVIAKVEACFPSEREIQCWSKGEPDEAATQTG